jgi:hypothetical protein
VLAGEERNHAGHGHVTRQVVDQVLEVLFLRRPHRVVGEEDDGVLLRQAPDTVVHVDPGVHGPGPREAGGRGAELNGHERPLLPQALQQSVARR